LQANLTNIYKMITKKRRLAIIQELVNTHAPNSQGKLLKLLHDRGFTITQTTLSRDIKELKISKMPDDRGNYIYMNPLHETNYSDRLFVKNKTTPPISRGFISFDFSYQFGVIKTRPGFAGEIALDINNHASSTFLGSIPGNDTLLLIPREGVSRQEILDILTKIIPGFKREEIRTPK